MGAPEELERCPLMPTYGAPQLQLVRGEGSWVWDRDGHRYLDLLSGLAVTSLGHSHPAVAEALAEQARTLLHVSNLFGTEPGWQVARTLDRLLGGGGQVFFANSGAEANECALKLARKHGGRGGTSWSAPSGRSTGGPWRRCTPPASRPSTRRSSRCRRASATWPGATWRSWSAPSTPRGGHPARARPGRGRREPRHEEYFAGVRRICDERGILFMVDEVQTGLGRCGAWFAHQRLGVRPDVVTMAKALGNGVPIGACWARAEVAAAFEPGDHATTYGGQPLATAAARAVLEVMEAEDVPARAERAGQAFRTALAKLPGVAGVRGLGLLLAVELDGAASAPVAARLLELGVIVNAVTPTALRLAPSLLISDDEIGLAVDHIGAAIEDVAGTGEGT
jgi:acetylornithine/N-succinyldiaminopimelate aminotransferase